MESHRPEHGDLDLGLGATLPPPCLQVECDAHDMVSPTDYRRLAKHQKGLYFVEPGSRDQDLADEFTEVRWRGLGGSWGRQGPAVRCLPLTKGLSPAKVLHLPAPCSCVHEQLAEGTAPIQVVVPVMMGRELTVPQCVGKACMFGFDELCGRPLAAADYLALAQAYHTLMLRGVPVFSAANRSEAYRFVTLIDVLYEHR